MTRYSLSSARYLGGIVVLLSLVSAALPVRAADSDERWYQIELIVFENKNADDTTEVWSNDPGKPDLNNTIELHKGQSNTTATVNGASNTSPATQASAAAPATEPFTLLPDDQLALNDAVKRLEDSRDYQPLLHIGWRQPVPERNNGQPVLIDSRKLLLYTARIANDTPPADQGTTDSATQNPPAVDDQGPDEIVTTINENFVSGTLTLTRGRYLHMGLDLLYQRQPNSPQFFSFFGFGSGEATPELYRMTQSRRMRRGEVHYFDHPKFGVLAMVTAVENDGEDEDGEAQTIPLKPRP